ncbi:homeobox protein Mohawk-like [Acanthaster planci]|uniref:Homeobox protein Mohawk-like n=1 Tax=Acanthaster planci TaxID=133434 RepID=A0A8B7ZH90_ACAPL|nr:homeobox protein Mohawk-like [Acanthaster planci]
MTMEQDSTEGEMLVSVNSNKGMPTVPLSEDRQNTVCRDYPTCRPLGPDGDSERSQIKGLRTRGNSPSGILLSSNPSHRRRTLQDMTKPLKTWLYENRSNPYPTKKEKVALAADSEMTLVQVSNWFANARRRLKNTAQKPGLTWSKRVKLCNRQASDNAEGLSVASSASEELGVSIREETEKVMCPDHPCVSAPRWASSCGLPAGSPAVISQNDSSLEGSPPSPAFFPETTNSHKFKQSILHRYLNDSIALQRSGYHLPQSHEFATGGTVRYSESVDSSCSPTSIGSDGNQSAFHDECALCADYRPRPDQVQSRPISKHGDVSCRPAADADEIYWKEIIAAVVLTNMARAKQLRQGLL